MTTIYAEGETTDKQHMLIDEGLFKQTLIKERKRTDRSGLAMVMLLVGIQVNKRETMNTPAVGIANALCAIKSDIDILGWFEQGRVVGLLVPEIDPFNLSAVCEQLECELRKALIHSCDQDRSQNLSLELRIYPEPWNLEEAEHQRVDPLFFPENRRKVVSFRALKRGVDVVLSLFLLLLLAPLLLILAALVKVSSHGPVIFRQVRVGRNMKPFMMWKFRTMYANADHGVHHNYVSWFITSSDRKQDQVETTVFKLTNDSRITPLGRLLRRTSLDELPQLWNVLIGEMSLVGPRPPLWYELERYKPWHRSRVLVAKPGITGLWQVVGRSRTTFDEMVRLDLRYARTMSLWGDIKILLMTPAAVITGKGAC
jgi:lipopolysaccharide/colanic/teichoic acid biosynthesis glycosyltransferase